VRAAVNGPISFALGIGAHLGAVAVGYGRTIMRSLRSAGRQSLQSSKSNGRVRWSGPKRHCGHGTPAYQSIPFARPAALSGTRHGFSMALSSIRRIRIRWGGRRRAARALQDAMPLLCKADALTVVATATPAGSQRKAPPPVWVSILQSRDFLQRSSHSRHPAQCSAPSYRLRLTQASTCW